VKDFSDAEENLDLNNIPDGGNPIRHNPAAGNNPIDVNQNWLNLFVGSLMPWNDLPQQPGQGDQAN
jgi:hypothetical protein